MHRLRLHRRYIAWVMLITFVVIAMAPGVVRAMAVVRGNDAPWSLVCSDRAVVGGGATPGSDSGRLLVHCPYCGWQADTLALPPVAPRATLAVQPMQAPPDLPPQAQRRTDRWATAQPRAPPARPEAHHLLG